MADSNCRAGATHSGIVMADLAAKPISRLELAKFLLSPALFVMVVLMVAEAMLAAATTWFVINAGRRVAVGEFLAGDLIWILTAQSASYVVGVISWIFAERAGYRGFGKYMLRFARDNRDKVTLLNEKPARERVEPFLTGETFQCFFNVMYELEFTLKLFLGLVFNSIVLGAEINVSLPFAYVGQCLQRQQLQSAALAVRVQDAAARRAGGANPRHRRARRHERDERHRQPRHRVRHRDRGGDEQYR
jgi:hypothetical protein